MVYITNEGKLARDTLRRFPNLPLNTLAKYLIRCYPELYNADVEIARSKLRYYAGKYGKQNRERAKDKSLFRGEVKIPVSIEQIRTPYKLKEGLWLNISDIHIPFHSIKAIEAIFQYGQMQKVDGILLNGDIQDCRAISNWFIVEKRDFIKEVEMTIDFLDFLRTEFKKIPIVWKPGNHEDRLEMYYSIYAPQLADLPTNNLSTILDIESRGITYLDRKQKILAGELPVLHGHELRGGNANLVNPSRWLFLKAKHNCMIGHFHRTSEHRERNIQGKDIVTWSTGCACSLEPDYNPEANNWNHGFALININKDGTFEVENRQILQNGKIV